MKTVAFVPIKFKSERLNNKNILPLGNYPLLWYIFNTLKQINLIDEIYVFCSDDRIINYIPDGVRYIKRHSKLDSNDTKGIEIYTEFANQIPADIYVLAHATSPFITPNSIQTGLEKIMKDNYDSAYSVQKCQTYVWYDYKPLNYDLDNIVRTQDLKPIFIETSAFYIFTRNVLMTLNKRIGTNPYQVITNRIESIDIDEIDDYHLAQNIIYSSLQNNIVKCDVVSDKSYLKNNIKMVIMDFDGTLSNGHIYINNKNQPDISKHYNVKDGYIISKLSKKGIKFAIISGNDLAFFKNIGGKLINNYEKNNDKNYEKNNDKNNDHIIGNITDKLSEIIRLCKIYDLDINKHIAYIGDDDNDIDAMKSLAFSGCPANASHNAKKHSQYISKFNGGEGAVRDFLEYIFE